MRRLEVRIAMFRVSVVRLVCLIWAVATPAAAFAQAQAANGNIEGTVRDATGGALPGVMVTLVNADLGSSRTVLTNDQGVFRAPLQHAERVSSDPRRHHRRCRHPGRAAAVSVPAAERLRPEADAIGG